MADPGTVIGWILAEDEREALLERFPPRYAKVVARHVTLKGDAADDPLPQRVKAEIVGKTDDQQGVEAMVVAIDGTTNRPGGSTYHITWSLADGRRARESNDVLKERGWKALEVPIAINMEPGRV